MLTAGPALAHPTAAPHLHETDALPLIMGLALIVIGMAAAIVVRSKSR
jgi:hypothetical protein